MRAAGRVQNATTRTGIANLRGGRGATSSSWRSGNEDQRCGRRSAAGLQRPSKRGEITGTPAVGSLRRSPTVVRFEEDPMKIANLFGGALLLAATTVPGLARAE